MIYTILSALPMLVCLFWTLLLLLSFRRDDMAKRMLTIWMGVAAVLYLCHCFYFNRVYTILPVTDSIYSLATLSVYPLYFLYIKQLTESRKLEVRDLWTLIPGVISCAVSAVIYAMMDNGERAAYIGQVLYGQAEAAEVSPLVYAQSLRYKIAGVVNLMQIVPILWLGSRKIARYNREINNYYSDTEGKTFSEIRTLLVFFVATSLTSFVMKIIGTNYFADSVWMILIPSLLFSTLLYALGYVGNRHNFTILDFARDIARDKEHENGSKEDPGDLVKAILELIEKNELYRQPDIKISDIARMLRSNRTYISAAINRDMKVSFSELIGRYRIECAKRLIAESLAEDNKLTKTDVIEASGFSNEASFYRTFKTVTGMTPRRWFTEQYPDK